MGTQSILTTRVIAPQKVREAAGLRCESAGGAGRTQILSFKKGVLRSGSGLVFSHPLRCRIITFPGLCEALSRGFLPARSCISRHTHRLSLRAEYLVFCVIFVEIRPVLCVCVGERDRITGTLPLIRCSQHMWKAGASSSS